jgi:hypothetical protein
MLAAFGISIDLPEKWEGKIFMYEPEPDFLVFPIVHAGNFSLPNDENTFGTLSMLKIRGRGAFLALVEQDPALAARPDFAAERLRLPIAMEDLDPARLPRRQPNLLGYQALFHSEGRPFVLQLMIGSREDTEANLASTNEVLSSLAMEKTDWRGR